MSELRIQVQRALGGAYTIERELGGGGMSRVFVARDESLGRDVVIKVLSPELSASLSAERFTREIKLAASLQEPHIVPVLAAGQTAEGLPWYSMPFVRGDSLRARLGSGRMSAAECVGILRNVAQALSYAHAHGLVHRDIKPENVLLSSGTAVVTDFGIAKALAASKTQAPGGTITQVGTSLGTPAYMAPEQITGDDVDARADLYAWGVMAYEMLAGRHPFSERTTSQQLLAAHLAEAPKSLVDAATAEERRDAALQRVAPVVMACLEKQPSARPASALALLASLDAVLTTSSAVPVGVGAPRRRFALVAAGVALVAVAAAAVAWMARPPASPLLEAKRVVVATFENKSGDKSLDPLGAMAADWIARGLVSTGLVDVGGTAADLAARGAATGAATGASALQALAREAKAGIVISGAYYRQGDSVLFQADFTDANAGKLVQSVGPVAASVVSPLAGVERLRQRVIGGLAPMVDAALVELAGATSRPPTIKAYREFLAGEDLFYRDEAAANDHYFRAAALDSTYLYPLVRVVSAYANRKDGRGLDSVMRVLNRHRAQLTPFEQGQVDWGEARTIVDIPRMVAAGRQLVNAAPKSEFARYLWAITARWTGDARAADSIFTALDPEGGALRGRVYFYGHHAMALHVMGNHDRELEVARRFLQHYPGRLYPRAFELHALAALGRTSEIAARVREILTMPNDLRVTPALVVSTTMVQLRLHGHAPFADSLGGMLLAWSDTRYRAHPDDEARSERGTVLMATHRWQALEALADTMLLSRPGDLTALGARGVALAMRNKRAEAGRIVQQLAAGAHRLDSGEDKRAMLLVLAALGEHARAMTLIDASELVNFGPPYTMVGEFMKDYPAFRQRYQGNP